MPRRQEEVPKWRKGIMPEEAETERQEVWKVWPRSASGILPNWSRAMVQLWPWAVSPREPIYSSSGE